MGLRDRMRVEGTSKEQRRSFGVVWEATSNHHCVDSIRTYGSGLVFGSLDSARGLAVPTKTERFKFSGFRWLACLLTRSPSLSLCGFCFAALGSRQLHRSVASNPLLKD